MRVIVILFLGITVVALVLKYFPAEPSDVATAPGEVEAATKDAEPRFLPPPAREKPVAPARTEPAKPATAKPSARDGALRPAVDRRDSPALAGALLHLETPDLVDELDRRHPELHERRRRLVVSFSHAFHGRPERAVEVAGDLVPGEGVAPEEFALLRAAVEGEWSGARAASARPSGTLLAAMELALLADAGVRALAAQRWKPAAEALSAVLLGDLRASWTSDRDFTRRWAERLNEAQAGHRWDPRGDWRSVTVRVERGDSLSLVRSRVVAEVPGLKVCTGLINRVNGVGERYLQPGEELRIPLDPARALVDLDARHALFLFGDEVAAVWEVAVGAEGSETPEGEFRVGDMREDPPWFRPGEGMIPYGDPRNELGTHWIGWDRLDGQQSHYGFHGTWEPETVGESVSDGCIRMRNADVAELYRILPRGTKITVQR